MAKKGFRRASSGPVRRRAGGSHSGRAHTTAGTRGKQGELGKSGPEKPENCAAEGCEPESGGIVSGAAAQPCPGESQIDAQERDGEAVPGQRVFEVAVGQIDLVQFGLRAFRAAARRFGLDIERCDDG